MRTFNCCGDLSSKFCKWLKSESEGEGGSKTTLYTQKDDSALMHKIPMSIFLREILTSNSAEDGMATVIAALDTYNRAYCLNPENRSLLSRASYTFRPHKTNDHSMMLMVVAGTSADGRPLYRKPNKNDNFDDVFAIKNKCSLAALVFDTATKWEIKGELAPPWSL